jgi:hypothetical protein
LIEVFGKEEAQMGARPNVDGWEKILGKPPKFVAGDTKADAWANYREKSERFFDLVRNDQDDNARHQNYWIAFNILFVQGQSLYWRDELSYTLTLGAVQFEKHLDKILLTMFADKVFTKVALAEGKTPTGKYDNYVMTEEEA